MKKIFIALCAMSLLITSCSKNEKTEEVVNSNEEVSRACHSMENLERQLSEDPSLSQRMNEIERITKNAIETGRLLPDGTVEIPVVFNVIYKTATENISDAQLQSQIDVLNEDFGATNGDYNLTSTYNSVKAGDTKIRFVLAATNRKFSSKTSWRTDDAMKFASSGGINATTPSTHLNIWVVNKMVSQGRTILGYAQFPGGALSTDGVVLGYNYTGRVGALSAPYNLGRTATHEVGHWLNLRHIWGDATCGNDLVNDTPTHNTSNGGCPPAGHLSTCSGTPVEMTMNYMDYTYDACMYMFSIGQKQRMQATFVAGGGRNSFAQP
jgi:Pregnancy-associated plasma protein-A